MPARWTNKRPTSAGVYFIYLKDSEFYDPPNIFGLSFETTPKGQVTTFRGEWMDNAEMLEAKGALWQPVMMPDKP